MDSEEIKNNVRRPDIWVRGLHMLILFIALRITEIILYAVAIFQFASVVITTERHEKIDGLAKDLAMYIKNIYLYLTFNSDHRPFPFADWDESIK